MNLFHVILWQWWQLEAYFKSKWTNKQTNEWNKETKSYFHGYKTNTSAALYNSQSQIKIGGEIYARIPKGIFSY